jgi:hypothetical protein
VAFFVRAGNVFCLHIFIAGGLAVVDPLAGLAIDFAEGHLPAAVLAGTMPEHFL